MATAQLDSDTNRRKKRKRQVAPITNEDDVVEEGQGTHLHDESLIQSSRESIAASDETQDVRFSSKSGSGDHTYPSRNEFQDPKSDGPDNAHALHRNAVNHNDDHGNRTDGSSSKELTIQSLFSKLLRQNNGVLKVDAEDLRASAPLRSAKVATQRLEHDRYTVGWICALPVEMMAARAMLDEEHLPLPNSAGDHNAYQLGAIGGRNIVMTCIRSGVYGLTSATAAAIAMASTYSNSTVCPVLVGIGGGVPHHGIQDIRLGDVVIGTPSSVNPAVRQYDLGKTVNDGILKTTGTLNKPAPTLLNALSLFQSGLTDSQSTVSRLIEEALETLPNGFSRPRPERDMLHVPECDHSSKESCPEHLIHREPRTILRPEIHYGSIASGNQVIKHAQTRDRIATKSSGILCFEMEAAGVMDYMPCLVIRGISDYCDAHKLKDWQGYAALAAAAVAKVLLLVSPTKMLSNESKHRAWDHANTVMTTKHIDQDKTTDRRRKILESLQYQDYGVRRATIRRAHADTCKWVFKQQQLRDWMDATKYEDHHGIIWIKGKPGTGKSTVMKYLVEQAEEFFQDKGSVVITSFFFNARGAELVRSNVGTYRALLIQIFETLPALQSLLDSSKLNSVLSESSVWTAEMLEDVLRKVVKGLGQTHLVIFIDALDECPERQVREMVDFLAKLAESAHKGHLHICFASRHYPHVSLHKGYEFILEQERGHSEDILRYLDTEFILDNAELTTELKRRMFTKSGRIFLWIVLVVQLLKQEYDHGGIHRLSALLDDVPAEVSQLFQDMLRKDSNNLPQLVVAMQWVLYARRPLRLDELYHAMLYASPASKLPLPEIEATPGDMKRYILSCSKGMLEGTDSSNFHVQFIHETVREYLLQPEALKDLWPGFEGISQGDSHDFLKKSCMHYIEQVEISGQRRLHVADPCDGSFQKWERKYPFTSYAITNVLTHAEQAQSLGLSQAEFLKTFNFMLWRGMRKVYKENIDLDTFNILQLLGQHDDSPKAAGLGLALATNDLMELFECWVANFDFDSAWNAMLPSLIVALLQAETGLWNFDGRKRRLLVEKCEMLLKRDYEHRHPFKRMARADLVCSLLCRTLLELPKQPPVLNVADLREIIDSIGIRAQEDYEYVVWQQTDNLLDAAKRGDDEGAEKALQLGANVNARDYYGNSAMHYAIQSQGAITGFDTKYGRLILLLQRHGADLDLRDCCGRSPLHMAVLRGYKWLVKYIIDRGALLSTRDANGDTPLDCARRLEPKGDIYSMLKTQQERRHGYQGWS